MCRNKRTSVGKKKTIYTYMCSAAACAGLLLLYCNYLDFFSSPKLENKLFFFFPNLKTLFCGQYYYYTLAPIYYYNISSCEKWRRGHFSLYIIRYCCTYGCARKNAKRMIHILYSRVTQYNMTYVHQHAIGRALKCLQTDRRISSRDSDQVKRLRLPR